MFETVNESDFIKLVSFMYIKIKKYICKGTTVTNAQQVYNSLLKGGEKGKKNADSVKICNTGYVVVLENSKIRCYLFMNIKYFGQNKAAVWHSVLNESTQNDLVV